MKAIDASSSENLCMNIVMDSIDAVIAIDNNYEVILVNKTTTQHSLRIFNTEICEGNNLKELFCSSQKFMESWDSVFLSGSKTSKIFWNSKQTHCYEITCTPIKNELENIKAVYGVVRLLCKNDSNTLLHQFDTQIVVNFEKIVDYFPHMVWTALPDGNTDYFNQRWIDYTGFNYEQSKGYGWETVIHPDDLKDTSQKYADAIASGTPYQIRYRLRKHNNTFRWHVGRAEPIRNANGNIMKWIGTCTDVDDMVHTEAKLSQLQLLLEAARIGAWTLDFQNDMVYMDNNTLSLLNMNPTENLATLERVLDHIHPEDKPKVEAEIQKAVTHQIMYDAEMRIYPGSEKYIAARGKIEHTPEGAPLRMVGINWDITARKILEKERVQALEYQEELGRQRIQEAQEHHKRLEEFVDTICHEIRNPLNGISGMLSLMQSCIEPVLEKEEQLDVRQFLNHLMEHINIMEQCAEQQRIIVDDVLDLSKVENDKLELSPTVFNPRNLLENLKNIFAGSIKQKQLECIIILSEGADCTFKADAHRLSQIIMNLLSNSIKFTECGTITVEISKEIMDGENRKLHFKVTDTGIGMTSDEVARLFNKFSQANSTIGIRYGGSGLGLMISKKLVELMGGIFHVKSEKGKGTRFEFSIQCKEVKDVKSLPKVRSKSTTSTLNLNSKRILIVEDSIINQKILTSYLQQQKCICQVVNNGVEALSAAEHTKFDVIFMDLEMPLMGGLEATQKLREKQSLNQHTPIIGLSGNARREHVEEAIKSGMNAYLTKPYHKTDIYKAVSQMCEDEHQHPNPNKERIAKRIKSSQF